MCTFHLLLFGPYIYRYHGNWQARVWQAAFQIVCLSLPSFHDGWWHTRLCVACLGAEHARSAIEGADCPHCVCMSMQSLHSRRALFEEGALTSAPRGSVPTLVEAERRLKSWGSQMDLTESLETGTPFSPSTRARSWRFKLFKCIRAEWTQLRENAPGRRYTRKLSFAQRGIFPESPGIIHQASYDYLGFSV